MASSKEATTLEKETNIIDSNSSTAVCIKIKTTCETIIGNRWCSLRLSRMLPRPWGQVQDTTKDKVSNRTQVVLLHNSHLHRTKSIQQILCQQWSPTIVRIASQILTPTALLCSHNLKLQTLKLLSLPIRVINICVSASMLTCSESDSWCKASHIIIIIDGWAKCWRKVVINAEGLSCLTQINRINNSKTIREEASKIIKTLVGNEWAGLTSLIATSTHSSRERITWAILQITKDRRGNSIITVTFNSHKINNNSRIIWHLTIILQVIKCHHPHINPGKMSIKAKLETLINIPQWISSLLTCLEIPKTESIITTQCITATTHNNLEVQILLITICTTAIIATITIIIPWENPSHSLNQSSLQKRLKYCARSDWKGSVPSKSRNHQSFSNKMQVKRQIARSRQVLIRHLVKKGANAGLTVTSRILSASLLTLRRKVSVNTSLSASMATSASMCIPTSHASLATNARGLTARTSTHGALPATTTVWCTWSLCS